ncbi:hypothetical protein NQ318_017546 [Aromia moschata]|uniref:Enhancer of polycomb-like protein n=1 Tax=Aromia moschata TaxID=1265417 RepID=A0AAV8Z3I2_9CUCU|nr:hypothetical protein NQ318_017546 [Aromia moschata]
MLLVNFMAPWQGRHDGFLHNTLNMEMPVSDGPSCEKLVFRRFYVGLVVCFVLSTNMSKLSFRARALDASKPMPIYMAEELPDLPDYSAINRAVPQMPSGMQKEEECEHHLQRAICAGLIIPTPEVSDMPSREFYDKVYPANYKQPRQLIHMQPFTMEQDIPDYDMDSEDERWLQSQTQKLDLTPLKFEEMMDRLEKSSGQTVVTLNEAKALLKEDDDLIIAVFDYWLNKRLKTQHPLILTVKTEHRAGTAANNPYLAFRRRTEKMQTRKNRKNDEASYEKMLKLRRDLYRAVTLLELVKRREKIKREYVHLTVEVFEKRYQAKDFSGAIMAEASAIKSSRPAFTPIFHNHYPNQGWSNKAILKEEVIPRREKRPYKKRKHKALSQGRSGGLGVSGVDSLAAMSSDEEAAVPHLSPDSEETEDEGQFAFRRNKLCSYHMPLPHEGNWPWCSKEERGLADRRFRFSLTSLSNPRRCVGFARRRVGRGGRVILDRIATDYDDFWRTLDFSIVEPGGAPDVAADIDVKSQEFGAYERVGALGDGVVKVEVKREPEEEAGVPEDGVVPLEPVHTKEEKDEMVDFLRSLRRDWLHFRPKTPPPDYEPPCDMLLSSDTFFNPSANAPFSMEIQTLDGAGGSLLDASTFVADPFAFDGVADLPDTPVTDTRQATALPDGDGASDGGAHLDDGDPDSDPHRTIGCSRFTVTDLHGCRATRRAAPSPRRDRKPPPPSTATSPKVNSVSAATGGGRGGRRARGSADGNSLGSTNGLLTQFSFEGEYAPDIIRQFEIGGVRPARSNFRKVPANILDIPITNDPDAGKLGAEASGGPVSANNKAKTIVRKNNLIMEVT